MMEDEWFEPVRERLILRRKQLGLTQGEVAQWAGTATSHLCHMERGLTRGKQPGPAMVARWAKALRIDTEITLRLDAAEWPEPFVLDLTPYLRL